MDKKEIYSGFEIQFDNEKEVWYTHVKETKDDMDDTRLENTSLKKLKELLDIVKRRKFERMPVLVRTINHYRFGGGRDKTYDPQYEEATLTSVAPNGNAYFVRKGGKHGDKINLKYHDHDLLMDTPENRKIVMEIEEAGKAEWQAEITQLRLKDRLKGVDGKKLYKQVYGKDLS